MKTWQLKEIAYFIPCFLFTVLVVDIPSLLSETPIMALIPSLLITALVMVFLPIRLSIMGLKRLVFYVRNRKGEKREPI